jgi:hypothetical protein
VEHISGLVTYELETMAHTPTLILSKRKAICALLPHAIFMEQGGQQGMIDAIFRAARASRSKDFLCRQVTLYASRLFEKRSQASLDRVIVLISPYIPWGGALNNSAAVARWAAAVSAVPWTEEVGQNLVNALIAIASIDFLRPHIPIDIWRLLKRRPSLTPLYYVELDTARHQRILAYIRGLGDIEILKSFFLVIWSDQISPPIEFSRVVERYIRDNFGGTGMEGHRKDLVERLDQILPWTFGEARKGYSKLRDALLEVER